MVKIFDSTLFRAGCNVGKKNLDFKMNIYSPKKRQINRLNVFLGEIVNFLQRIGYSFSFVKVLINVIKKSMSAESARRLVRSFFNFCVKSGKKFV